MESNLLKLDMLGHDDPSMIRMMEDLSGMDAKTIPLDDPDTRSIFITSRALGYEDDPVLGPTGATAIPEFGTSFVRGMLEETKPTEFDILVRLSGFSHGTDVWLGNARDLILSGTATVGQAIGCRDDIMLYLISCGMKEKRAFKIMEAVRKGRGLPEGAEDEMKEHGVPDWYIGSCKKIAYLFPKAHAVAYVMMAFRIAWFKVHDPLVFYAAYFSIRAKAFDATVMCLGMDRVKAKMNEIRAKDKDASAVEQDMLTTLEVVYEFYLRGYTFDQMDLYRSDAVRFQVDRERKALIPPFMAIPGLGETAAVSIVEQRKGKQYLSVEEFSADCPKVTKAHIELLTAAPLGNLPETSDDPVLKKRGGRHEKRTGHRLLRIACCMCSEYVDCTAARRRMQDWASCPNRRDCMDRDWRAVGPDGRSPARSPSWKPPHPGLCPLCWRLRTGGPF
jgi:DNA polymerase-3 subunit alpha (Gram-positive type)